MLNQNKKDLDNKKKAKCFAKLGKLLKENNVEELTIENIEKITSLYKQAITFDKSYYKAWNSYAMINFDAIEKN